MVDALELRSSSGIRYVQAANSEGLSVAFHFSWPSVVLLIFVLLLLSLIETDENGARTSTAKFVGERFSGSI